MYIFKWHICTPLSISVYLVFIPMSTFCTSLSGMFVFLRVAHCTAFSIISALSLHIAVEQCDYFSHFQLRFLGDDIKEGDVILSNHPSAGGSHLPDLTVITPVGKTLFELPKKYMCAGEASATEFPSTLEGGCSYCCV